MTTRMFPCVIAASFCVGVSCGDEPKKAAQEELKLFEGEWRIVTVEADGKTTESKTIVKFASGKCTISQPGSGIPDIETTVTLDPSKKPKWIDVTNAKQVTHKGIYEQKGDTMKAVFQGDEKGERPTEFKSKKGEVMFSYERVKPK